MTDLEGFKKECEDGDRLLLLAMADAAEERGDERLARGFRWLHSRHKWPQRWVISRKRAVWVWQIATNPMGDALGGSIPWTPKMGNSREHYEESPAMTIHETCYDALEKAALAFYPRWKKGRKPTT